MVTSRTACRSFVMLAALTGLVAAPAAHALQSSRTTHGDNLLIHRVQQENSMNLPRRGLSMAQVERDYGAPLRKLSPRGGDTKKHPVIHRWDYAKFIVYFEHDHVIHSVLNTPAGNNTNPTAAQ